MPEKLNGWFEKKFKDFSIGDFLIKNALIIILIIMAIVAAIYNGNFVSANNFKNISINFSARFLIALGVSGCLITRGTDLSAGRMAGLGACIAGTLLQTSDYAQKFFPNLGDVPILAVFVLAMVICGFFGLINGIVVSYLKVPPFIATLGTQTIVYGACQLYSPMPLGGYRKDYTALSSTFFLGNSIPLFIVIAALVGAFMWFLYNKTRHGKYMYAIGGNETAAEVSGVNVSKTLIIIYTLAGLLYAAGGVLLGAKAGGATVNTGYGYELEAIASCTIGGVSTTGGIGKISGIVIGVLVFEFLKTSMQFLGINPAVQYIIQGVVIILAVALDLRKYLAKK
ncbi:MAG: beta-methylgalactoside transporter [Oscillospiraceae bacterium]|jgi:methyl-galactoside transport system permease protein|nr:beta-methylgalactoside transporter [Oscillospiraceae bacterium]